MNKTFVIAKCVDDDMYSCLFDIFPSNGNGPKTSEDFLKAFDIESCYIEITKNIDMVLNCVKRYLDESSRTFHFVFVFSSNGLLENSYALSNFSNGIGDEHFITDKNFLFNFIKDYSNQFTRKDSMEIKLAGNLNDLDLDKLRHNIFGTISVNKYSLLVDSEGNPYFIHPSKYECYAKGLIEYRYNRKIYYIYNDIDCYNSCMFNKHSTGIDTIFLDGLEFKLSEKIDDEEELDEAIEKLNSDGNKCDIDIFYNIFDTKIINGLDIYYTCFILLQKYNKTVHILDVDYENSYITSLEELENSFY